MKRSWRCPIAGCTKVFYNYKEPIHWESVAAHARSKHPNKITFIYIKWKVLR